MTIHVFAYDQHLSLYSKSVFLSNATIHYKVVLPSFKARDGRNIMGKVESGGKSWGGLCLEWRIFGGDETTLTCIMLSWYYTTTVFQSVLMKNSWLANSVID